MAKVFSGARAKLGIFNPSTGKINVIGLFNNVSYGLSYGHHAVYILGRFSPAEIEYTDQSEVAFSASGWRSIGHGPHAEISVPKLQDLLTSDYLVLALVDRQTEASGADGTVAKFNKVRVTGYSTTVSARQLVEITVNFVGATAPSDETATNAEHPTATDLP
jgi:hypothetical protein